MATATIWCRSRSAGAICTRAAGHSGLHNRFGTGRMWSTAQADAPRCAGSGARATAAPPLADGFPHGAGVCPVCWGFIALADAALQEHDAFTGPADPREAADRATWFNTHGWSDAASHPAD